MSAFSDAISFNKTFISYIPKPSIYRQNNDDVILFSARYGIYSLLLTTNTVERQTKFTNWRPYYHGQYYDNTNNSLTMYGGLDLSNKECVCIFDINQKSIQLDTAHELRDIACSSVVKMASRNIVHSFSFANDHHYIYNTVSKGFIINSTIGIVATKGLDIDNQLIIFGGKNSTKILKYKGVMDWKPLAVSMSRITNPAYYDIIHINYVVIVFYFDTKDIYCIDITHNKIYKSDQQIPPNIKPKQRIYVVKHNNNHDIAYLMNFQNGYRININLWDLIPTSLNKEYNKKYETLIMGFVNEVESLILVNVPLVLKLLTLRYFNGILFDSCN